MQPRTVLQSIGATVAVGAGPAIRAQSGNHAMSRDRTAIVGTGHLGRALATGWNRAGHPLIAARYLEAMMRLSFGYYLYSKGKSFAYYLAAVVA
jgi:hypothetical protein